MTQAYNLAILANAVDTSGKLNVGTNATGTLPVANGGTGTSTPSLVAGTGITITGSFPNQTIATSGGGGGQFQCQLFTSSGTWTAPTGVTRVFAVLTGGGGGAGNDWARSGGNGGLAVAYLTVTPGTTYTVTIASGGTGAYGTGNGSAGGTSSFGSFMSATGGGGGSGTGVIPNGTGTVSSGTAIRSGSDVAFGSVGASYGGFFPLVGNARNENNGSPIAYATNRTWFAGTAGLWSGDNNLAGGVGGALYLEWVGS